jgi:O-antigen ligase
MAVAVTTGAGVGGSWFDEHRILLSIAACAAATALVSVNARTVLRTCAFTGLLWLALALGLASALWAVRSHVAVVEWATLAIVCVIAASGLGRDAALRQSGAWFAGVIAFAYTAGVVANIGSSIILGVPLGRDTFLVGFSNSRFPAQLQALTLPLLPLALALLRHPLAKAGLSLVFALWWMCVIGSGSRTAWLALATAAILMACIGAAGRQWLSVQARFALAGAVLYVGLFVALPAWLGVPAQLEVGRLGDTNSIAARLELAKIAFSMITDHPWLGVGPMHFAYVDNGYGAHPHNFWLQLGAEWGLPVLGLVAAACIVLYRRVARAAWRTRHDADAGLLPACLLAALTVWIVGTQFDGYMVVPTSQVTSAVVLMLCVALTRREGPSSPQQPRPMARTLAFVPLVICLGATTVLATLPFTPFGQPTEREARWRTENPIAAFWPRFWQQGWIGPEADPTAR